MISLALVALAACKAGSGAESPLLSGTRIVGLSVGRAHTCALSDAAEVVCWGKGFDGSRIDHPPTRIPMSARPATLSAGVNHDCVLTTDATVRCWGLGDWGRLGYGDTRTRTQPGSDIDVGGAVSSIATGQGSTCAVLVDGAIRCWGTAQGGRLGYGDDEDIGDDEPPASAGDVEVGAPALAVDTDGHTCAVLLGGNVRCWGTSRQGELGVPMSTGASIGRRQAPSAFAPIELGEAAVDVRVGTSFTCVRLESGAVRCWGFGGGGRLGYGDTHNIGDDESPATAGNVDVAGKAVDLALGTAHACVLLEGGTVRCWGRNTRGQLGRGDTRDIGDDEVPASTSLVDVGAKVVAIAAGGDRTCVVLEGGTVRCWGAASGSGSGTLGYGREGDIGDDETPADVGDVPLFR